MRQNDPFFGPTHDLAEVAGILGLPASALDPAYPIQTVSTGLAFCVVLFRSVAELARMEIAQTAAQLYLERMGAKFFYCLAPAETPGVAFHARMQFYNGEDPATGSAAGCAVSWLVLHGLLPSNTPADLEQGIEIRRPSRLHVKAMLTDGKISSVFVGGRTIHVANGSFLLPPEPAFPQPIVTEP
jgi:trans-2,3-dihydro-3-hydroxyanthranilate isomerase